MEEKQEKMLEEQGKRSWRRGKVTCLVQILTRVTIDAVAPVEVVGRHTVDAREGVVKRLLREGGGRRVGSICAHVLLVVDGALGSERAVLVCHEDAWVKLRARHDFLVAPRCRDGIGENRRDRGPV